VISNADSHAAVTKSDKDRSELEQVLDNQFHVPRLGTTCTYSISPASASIPAAGGEREPDRERGGGLLVVGGE